MTWCILHKHNVITFKNTKMYQKEQKTATMLHYNKMVISANAKRHLNASNNVLNSTTL